MDRDNMQSPQPNLQEVLFVMGGRSLDDSDEDSDDEEDRDPRLQRLLLRNCAFYNTKTSKNMSEMSNFQVCLSSAIISQQKFVVRFLETAWRMSGQSLNVALTEKLCGRNAFWM